MDKYECIDVQNYLKAVEEVGRVIGGYFDANSLVNGGKNLGDLEKILGAAMKIPVDLMYPELEEKLDILRGAIEIIEEKDKHLKGMRV